MSEGAFISKIFYDYVMKHVGLPYLWAGNTPLAGFDCSGLVIEFLQSVGIYPHQKDTTAMGLLAYFEKHLVDHPSFGALLFFGDEKRVTHVTFALSETLMLGAEGGDSKVIDLKAAVAKKAYVKMRPINYRKNLYKIALPPYPFPLHL